MRHYPVFAVFCSRSPDYLRVDVSHHSRVRSSCPSFRDRQRARAALPRLTEFSTHSVFRLMFCAQAVMVLQRRETVTVGFQLGFRRRSRVPARSCDDLRQPLWIRDLGAISRFWADLETWRHATNRYLASRRRTRSVSRAAVIAVSVNRFLLMSRGIYHGRCGTALVTRRFGPGNCLRSHRVETTSSEPRNPSPASTRNPRSNVANTPFRRCARASRYASVSCL
jgi:hypothetical protein